MPVPKKSKSDIVKRDKSKPRKKNSSKKLQKTCSKSSESKKVKEQGKIVISNDYIINYYQAYIF